MELPQELYAQEYQDTGLLTINKTPLGVIQEHPGRDPEGIVGVYKLERLVRVKLAAEVVEITEEPLL